MLVLAGHHRQGDSYEALTEERPRGISSSRGVGLEANSFGPPFAPLGGAFGARRWKPLCLVRLALLMAWMGDLSLVDRFRAARSAMRRLFPSARPGQTYQGFSKAVRKYGTGLLALLGGHLRAQIEPMSGCWRVCGRLAFAVDGSRVECPRTAANERQFKRAGRKKTGPQLSLTTIYHMGSGCPWDYRIGPGTQSERTHLRAMLATLPLEALLVADAGFIGYALLREILASGRHVLFRVGANVQLLRELGYAQVQKDSTVYLWPEKARQKQQPPLVLRLIRLAGGRHPAVLVSDLPDERLSDEQAGVLYRLRWGVEVFYRSLKQTLARRKMRSTAPEQARMELAWAFMGLWVLSLLGAQAIAARGKNPQSLSIACALRHVRQTLERCDRRAGRLSHHLGLCVKDGYVRSHPKTARNWPHKKNDPPPGVPKIILATTEQIRHAKELLAQTPAA